MTDGADPSVGAADAITETTEPTLGAA
jgi:hypothetical protein